MAEKKYQFGGYSTDSIDTDSTFQEYEEGDSFFYIENDIHECEISNKKVKYQIVIENLDFHQSTGEKNGDRYIVTLFLVPIFKSLSKSYKQSILDEFNEEEQKYYNKNYDMLTRDIFDYGFNIPLETQSARTEKEAEKLVEIAKAIIPCVTGLIGFVLDAPRNMIGNTGWDFLEDYCSDKDLLKLAMKRCQ